MKSNPDDLQQPTPDGVEQAKVEMWEKFHNLWGYAKVKRYEKQVWIELQQILMDLGL